jgi:hypothetical protein
MDPFAAQVSLNTYVTAQTYVDGIVDHGKGVVQGIQDGNYLNAAGNGLLLGLDVAPFIPLKGVTSAASLPTRLVRIIPEEIANNATTLGKAGDIDAFVVGASELKGLTTSEEVARKLSLFNKDGSLVRGPFRIIEFDTPTSGLAQPFNRANTGFINGGKTAGGATEYVIPNVSITELKNVTQTTIK